MFGKLTRDAIPHHWYTISATLFIAIALLVAVIFLTKYRRWGWLWREYLTSTDPKKIGTMYMVFSLLMFFRGLVDAAMVWLQQSIAKDAQGFLSAEHFQQIFTSHGDIMVFFVTMGFFFGLMNWIVPLQIGARDLAFPFLNSLSFWLTVSGGILINLFFVVGGNFANTGWLAIAPLSELEFNPGVGVDYLIWSLQLSGLGSLLAGINFMVTILKKRAPGMNLMKMPLFTWTSLCSTLLIISAFPVLTATLFLLWLDRFFGLHIFSVGYGGNQMMYFNFIWMWGHPEVYILILPAFGMYSEIVSTFSQKRVFGYVSLVCATGAITLLSFLVWLHHFFTMGAGADVNAFFGIVTMFIAIPTGVQIFNWILTMFRGKVTFASPMYWFMGFVCTFTLGGMAGVLMASPPADFQVHNSLFLIAHFHTMIIGGAFFGIFAAITYWFPKVTGFKLDERLGKCAFWLWLVGFFVAFIPLYLLGLMGATRRLDHYPASSGWQPLYITATVGLAIIICGIIVQIIQLIVSIKNRKKNRDKSGDPWNGRTLEWATSSPPPFYNFALIPTVKSRDAFWHMKQQGRAHISHTISRKFAAPSIEIDSQMGKNSVGLTRSCPSESQDRSMECANFPREREKYGLKYPKKYENILLCKNTGMGIYISSFAFALGFALVWHILWLAIVGLIGIIVCIILRSTDEHTEYVLPAKEIKRMESHE